MLQEIKNLCDKTGYRGEKIGLMVAKSGDLHANAKTNNNSIKLTEKLLQNHKDHPDEILAIVAHELGHWKLKHTWRMALFNMFYMLVFGLLMTPIIENE